MTNQLNPSLRYATNDDFRRIFTEDVGEMHQLAYILTGDHAKAERCFVSGLEDALKSNDVFRDWASAWARRSVINNAIRLVQPHPGRSYAFGEPRRSNQDDSSLRITDTWLKASDVLALEDFDRFVFVICVLEGYSEAHCALLMGCSLREVRFARQHATQQIISNAHADLPADFPHNQQELHS